LKNDSLNKTGDVNLTKIKIIAHILCALVLFNIISWKQNDIQAKTRSDNNPGIFQEGVASWYGPGFQGRKTANGERFNTNELTAAHKTLPFNTLVKVTNVSNGQSIIVRINDRGPFTKGRVIDLSKAAKNEIGMGGLAQVQLELYDPEKEKEDLTFINLFNEELPQGTKVFVEFYDSDDNSDLVIDDLDQIFKAGKIRIKILTPHEDSEKLSLWKSSRHYKDITDKVNSLSGYTIEIATLLELSNASELIERLESENFNTIFLKEINQKDSTIYTVFVGNFNEIYDSENDLVKLQRLNPEWSALKLVKIGK
jgi:rare lipoprotein A